jgi:hypothetical protein
MVRSISIVALLGVFLFLFGSEPVRSDEKTPVAKNVIIIGRSSLRPPLAQHLDVLLQSNKTPIAVVEGHYGAKSLDQMLGSRKACDYVVMDAWQFKQGEAGTPEFIGAVTEFVKQVRAHSPQCKIILFSWWIPSGKDATNEGVMKVFKGCVEAAKKNDIWVATTGPAFMEARLARPDLRVTVSNQDAHPGAHGAYINACSLFAILTGESPVGLPATLKIPERLAIAPDDAKYLQELAWNVYQRELKHIKPANPTK